MAKQPMIVGRPALIVVDIQQDGALPPEAAGIPRMDGFDDWSPRPSGWWRLPGHAGVPVIFFQEAHRPDGSDFGRELDGSEGRHCVEGEPGTALWPTLVPGDDDYLIAKRRYSCFFGTDLQILLQGLGVSTLLLTGGLTDVCVQYTFADAHQHDYYTRVVEDAVLGSSRARHDAALDAMEYLQTGARRTTAEVVATLGALGASPSVRPPNGGGGLMYEVRTSAGDAPGTIPHGRPGAPSSGAGRPGAAPRGRLWLERIVGLVVLGPDRPHPAAELPPGSRPATRPRRLLRRRGPPPHPQPLRGPGQVPVGHGQPGDRPVAGHELGHLQRGDDLHVPATPGRLFHDGTPFNSSAIEPSFQRRTAVNGGPAYMVAGVASVQTPSPYTAVINLTTPNTAFLDYLASSYGPMMESPTALAANAGTDHDQTYLQTHDVGTGPYTLTQAKVGVSYQMQAFPQYWGKKPYYTTVNLPVIDNLSTQEIQFNSGQLAGILHDLTASAVAQYRGSTSAAFYSLPVIEEEGVYINEHTGFLTSQADRQALLQAVNSKAIVAGVFPNRAILPSQATPNGLLPAGYGKQSIAYNPSKLASVVKALPAGQKSLTVGYDSGAPDDQLVAEQIAAELQALGLTTKVVGYQTSEIYGWVGSASAAAAQGPNILVYYVWPDAYNAYTWNHITYDSTGGLQYLTCSVPGIDAIDTQAVTTGSNALYDRPCRVPSTRAAGSTWPTATTPWSSSPG